MTDLVFSARNRHADKAPDWVLRGEAEGERRFYFENAYGEQWVASITASRMMLAGGDIGWDTKSVDNPDYARLLTRLQNAGDFASLILNQAERSWLGAVMEVAGALHPSRQSEQLRNYLGIFSFDEKADSEAARRSSFIVVASAPTVVAVEEIFREYLVDVTRGRCASTFESARQVFLDEIIELPSQLAAPALVSFRSQSMDAPHAELRCGIVDAPGNVEAYGWGDEAEEANGGAMTPFLEIEPPPTTTSPNSATPRRKRKSRTR